MDWGACNIFKEGSSPETLKPVDMKIIETKKEIVLPLIWFYVCLDILVLYTRGEGKLAFGEKKIRPLD